MAFVTKIFKEIATVGGVETDTITAISGGIIEIQTGGTIQVQAGGVLDTQLGSFFKLNGTNIEAEKLLNQYIGGYTITQHASADISSGSALTPAYGVHVLSAATGMSKASAAMPIPSAGGVLYIDGGRLVGDANISVIGDSAGGVLMVNDRGSDLSSFEMSAGNFVKLACVTDGTWAVVEQSNFTEHASS